MSTYYEYREVKVMIAHELMKLDGWKVYGYKEDRSDSMTDYYDPANWDGIAEKNGYILCVHVYGASEEKVIKQYNYNNQNLSVATNDKITKLEQMTVERGASKQEERTAKEMIEKLQYKLMQEQEKNLNNYTIAEVIPAHMENPNKCNWHIEKDGVIVAKGNGILKYSSAYYEIDSKYIKEYQKDKKEYSENHTQDLLNRGYYDDEEKAKKCTISHIEDMEEKIKLINDFKKFINKLDTTCGCLVGDGEIETYERVTITEYKTEVKAVETEKGTIKEGQCIILKTSFNYGCNKGYVYRIHEIENSKGIKLYTAIRLNNKLTKELTGNANKSNTMFYYSQAEAIEKWINKGSIAFCELQEVNTPYEVEKTVKKVIKKASKTTQEPAQAEPTQETQNNTTIDNLTYEITDDTDTRDNSKIYLVKVVEKLSREDYLKVNSYMKSIGGYYSKFKHAFLFRENPTDILNKKQTSTDATDTNIITENVNVLESDTVEDNATDTNNTNSTNSTNSTTNTIEYEIEQTTHTKTGETIFLVKPKTNLSKDKFQEVKKQLATLKGFYSSFTHSFVFKYDPTEKLLI